MKKITVFLSLLLVSTLSDAKKKLSQRELIQHNYDLHLRTFRVRIIAGKPLFFEAWHKTRNTRTKLLLLEYTLATIMEAISFGARKRQIYPLVAELKSFITDHQSELDRNDRVWIEMQIAIFESMRWDTGDYS